MSPEGAFRFEPTRQRSAETVRLIHNAVAANNEVISAFVATERQIRLLIRLSSFAVVNTQGEYPPELDSAVADLARDPSAAMESVRQRYTVGAEPSCIGSAEYVPDKNSPCPVCGQQAATLLVAEQHVVLAHTLTKDARGGRLLIGLLRSIVKELTG